MKVCLLTEGSYPYIVGGVSAWTHMLIKGLPEVEFSVYSIGALAKDRGNFKYKLPENCTSVQEIFLDEVLAERATGLVPRRLNGHEREALTSLVSNKKDIDFDCLIEIFRKRKWESVFDIFMSEDFFDVIQAGYKERFSYLPFTDYFWTIRSMLLPFFYLLQQKNLPQADVYHSVATGYCGIIGAVAAAQYHKPFILTEHGIYARERENEIIKSDWVRGDFKGIWIDYFYNLARLAYQKADQVYTLFEHNAHIEAEIGCPTEKIHVVPNGIHMERFASVPKLTDHPGPIVIGAVVRVVPIKDISTLLYAFYRVQQERPDTEFYIMGNLEEEPEYAALMKSLARNLSLKHVHFTGTVNVAEYLPRMDILVLSSISEGQPLAVLEGFAAHRPYVTTDVGCCRELIYGDSQDHLGSAGSVVPPMNDKALADEILRLAGSFQLRSRMADIGYERVKNSYTYELFINAYREIYQSCHKLTKKGG